MARRETMKILMLALLAIFVAVAVSSEEREHITSEISEEAADRDRIPGCLSQGTQCEKADGFCYFGECPEGSIQVDKDEPSGMCGDSLAYCACCKPQDLCGTQNICVALGGRCFDMTRVRCYWKSLQGEQYCKGKNCGCCAPPRVCSTAVSCERLGGQCWNMATTSCWTKFLVGPQYCKEEGCGCCPRTSLGQLMATEEREPLEKIVTSEKLETIEKTESSERQKSAA